MNLTAISIDDEPRAHNIIEHYAAKVEQLELVNSFISPLRAASFLKEQAVDLIFLDINMPDLDGISLLKTLKTPPSVIFTTAYEEYAVESYEYEADGYLLKPIEFPKFYKAVMRVFEKKFTEKPKPVDETNYVDSAIFLKNGNKMLRFQTSEIRFIEASGNYAEIHLENQRLYVDHSLSELLEYYLPKNFVRIHRSYIINCNHITELEAYQVKVSEIQLPIGKTYRTEVRAFLSGK